MPPRQLLWYPRYVGDYRADTGHLTREQDYAYGRILEEIFWSGQHYDPPSIPDNDAQLMRLVKAASAEEWAEIRFELIDGPNALIQTIDGRLTQKRMAEEVRKALRKSSTLRQNANARWAATQGKEKRQRRATGKSGPHGANGSNGNGAEHMSRKQFLFFCSKINQWRDENVNLYVGGDEYADAFQRAFGVSLTAWEEEMRYHNAK